MKNQLKLLLISLMLLLLFSCTNETGVGSLDLNQEVVSETEKKNRPNSEYDLVVMFKTDAISRTPREITSIDAGTRGNSECINNLLKEFPPKTAIDFTSLGNSSTRSNPYQVGVIDFSVFKELTVIEGTQGLSYDELLSLAKSYEELDIVEYAEVLKRLEHIKINSDSPEQNVRSSRPDFRQYQWYRKGLHNGDTIGFDFDYAWSIGIKGQGVTVVYRDQGFDMNHEDLASHKFTLFNNWNYVGIPSHGTACAGIFIAKDNDIGVTGVVPDIDHFYAVENEDSSLYVSNYTEQLGHWILNAALISVGDVYSMSIGSAIWHPHPENRWRGTSPDISFTEWHYFKTLTDAGIIVVLPAGNDDIDYDNPLIQDKLSWNFLGDNGVIRVGAGTPDGRNRDRWWGDNPEQGSGFGSHVHLQGWGRDVATTGPHNTYSTSFAGTSSATPLVAAAAVAVQSYAKERLGRVLNSYEMRDLLMRTGTPGGSGWGQHTPPQPNVRAAIEELRGPSVNLIVDHNGGEGTTSGDGVYFKDDLATLTAKPAIGFRFKEWRVLHGSVIIDNPHSSNTTASVIAGSGMPGIPALVLAIFEPAPRYNLAIGTIGGNGVISGSGEYFENESINLTAKAELGYRFKEWIVTHGSVTINNPKTPNTTISIQGISNAYGAAQVVAVFEIEQIACRYPEFSFETIYTNGDTVQYNGNIWHARHWTQHQIPDSSSQWGPWAHVGACN